MEGLRLVSTASVLLRLFLCVLCGGAVGLERESRGQAAGLRTHVLVCLGAGIVMMTNQYICQYIDMSADPARLGAQVVSGIGFLGAGSIIVTRTNRVTGLSTAAGLWASGCLGIAIGIGFYEVALLGTVIIVSVECGLGWIDRHVFRKGAHIQFFIEISGMEPVREILELMKQKGFKVLRMEMIQSRIKNSGNQGLMLVVEKKREKKSTINRVRVETEKDELVQVLGDIQGVIFLDTV